MDWLDITGKRQVTATCISRVDWAAIVKEQPVYALEAVRILDAALYGEGSPEPQQPPDPSYAERLAAAQRLATGITWYEAALWCNALSASLKLDPAYDLNGIEAKWEPATSRARGKVTLTEYELVPSSKGVRLPNDKEYREALEARGFVASVGIHEWTTDRRRAPFIFESTVMAEKGGALSCNSIFRLPWNAFRVVRG
jgi:hypothetical protein